MNDDSNKALQVFALEAIREIAAYAELGRKNPDDEALTEECFARIEGACQRLFEKQTEAEELSIISEDFARPAKNEGPACSLHFSPKGKRILLVEDNELNSEIALDILTDAGAEVEQVWNGAEAVMAVSSKAADYYDVVLMDIQMPVMDGYEASRSIRALKTEDYSLLPIIALTARSAEEAKKDGKDAGMDGYIIKPIELDRLSTEMVRICRERTAQ